MLVRAWPCVALPWRGPRPPPGMPTWPTSAGRHATARPAVQPLAPLCTDEPAMIVLGGSAMHKGASGWTAGRAVACLPALVGQVGIPGGGLGPRHGSATHGQALTSIVAQE